ALLRARGHEDFGGRALDAVLGETPRDFLAQLRKAERRGVLPEVAAAAPDFGERAREVLEREESLVRRQAREVGDDGLRKREAGLLADAAHAPRDECRGVEGPLR